MRGGGEEVVSIGPRSYWYACADLLLSDSIHNLGLVGHIEDIVVNKDQQGKKLGLRIIEALDYIAEEVGCYKVSPLVFCSSGCLLHAVAQLGWDSIQCDASVSRSFSEHLPNPLALCVLIVKCPTPHDFSP